MFQFDEVISNDCDTIELKYTLQNSTIKMIPIILNLKKGKPLLKFIINNRKNFNAHDTFRTRNNFSYIYQNTPRVFTKIPSINPHSLSQCFKNESYRRNSLKKASPIRFHGSNEYFIGVSFSAAAITVR